MIWLLTVVLCILLVEVMVRAPLMEIVLDISNVAKKTVKILCARSISDHWKEKVLLAYSNQLFLFTLKLAFILIIIGAVVALFIHMFDFFGVGVGGFLISWEGVLYSLVIAAIYFRLRERFVRVRIRST